MSVCVELPLASPGSSSSSLGKRKRQPILRGGNNDGVQIINGRMVRIESQPANKTRASSSRRPSRAVSPEEVEDDYMPDQASEVEATSEAEPSAAPSKRIEKAPRKPPNRRSRYACTWEGCTKTYTRPVRLAEHMRSHTGERPFVCTQTGCLASYLRETHLAAHLRTHKNEGDKPLGCEEEGCGKRFWTNQHLKRHIKLVHENGKGSYPCEQCDKAFNKHHQLRSHVAQAHMAEGTKPFVCDHEGCDLSFTTGAKLRTHQKVHEDDRYVCMHPSHADQAEEMPAFPTWSALQEHNKTMHPPACRYPECKGKTFKTAKTLRKHMLRRHNHDSEAVHTATDESEVDTSLAQANGAYAEFDGGAADYEPDNDEESRRLDALVVEGLLQIMSAK